MAPLPTSPEQEGKESFVLALAGRSGQRSGQSAVAFAGTSWGIHEMCGIEVNGSTGVKGEIFTDTSI